MTETKRAQAMDKVFAAMKQTARGLSNYQMAEISRHLLTRNNWDVDAAITDATHPATLNGIQVWA